MTTLLRRGSLRRGLAFLNAGLLVAGLIGTASVQREARTVAVRMTSPEVEVTQPQLPIVVDDLVATTTTLAPTSTSTTPAPPKPRPRAATPTPRAPATTTAGNVTRHSPVTGPAGIYVVSTDGGPLRKLVAGDEVFSPAWSTDGTRLAYVFDNQIWVADADTGDSRPVTPRAAALASEPEWSASDNFIAYFASDERSGWMQMRVVDLRTGSVQTLGETSNPDEGGIAWSPTGDVVAWLSRSARLSIKDFATNQTAESTAVVGSAPLAWGPNGRAIAMSHISGLGVYAFPDLARFPEGYVTLRVDVPEGMRNPAWVGDQLYFVKPWELWAVNHTDGSTNPHVVSNDYVAMLRYSAKRPEDLFVMTAPPPYNVGTRRMERVDLNGGGRRVVAEPIAGQQITSVALSPRGDRLALVMFRVPPK